MATFIVGGQRTSSMTIDADGHREYKLTYLTQGDITDGPANHAQTAGLPVPGAIWVVDSDIDIWAWCRSNRDIRPVMQNEPCSHYEQTFTFSTRPPGEQGDGPSGKDDKGARKKCADTKIEDPLMEPMSVSGGGIRFTKEMSHTRYGKPLRYTSFEQIRGPQAEFEIHRDQVTVEGNVLNLQYQLVRSKVDKLNNAVQWDLPARCWKLADFTWSCKLYGTCGFYYTWHLVYESNVMEISASAYAAMTGSKLLDFVVSYGGKYWLPLWDHYVLDESTKVLNGRWHWISGSWVLENINGAAPVSTNPNHYIQAKDRYGNPIRVVLSKTTAGTPATDENDANHLQIQYYTETDHMELGIPVTL